jgi:hypothetical protein
VCSLIFGSTNYFCTCATGYQGRNCEYPSINFVLLCKLNMFSAAYKVTKGGCYKIKPSITKQTTAGTWEDCRAWAQTNSKTIFGKIISKIFT